MNENILAGGEIHSDKGYSVGTQEEYDAFVQSRNKSLIKARIRDFAEQSGFRSDVTVSDGDGNHIVTKTEQSLEKFAELIVQECIDVLLNEADVVKARGALDYIYEVLSLKEHAYLIDRHFLLSK